MTTAINSTYTFKFLPEYLEFLIEKGSFGQKTVVVGVIATLLATSLIAGYLIGDHFIPKDQSANPTWSQSLKAITINFSKGAILGALVPLVPGLYSGVLARGVWEKASKTHSTMLQKCFFAGTGFATGFLSSIIIPLPIVSGFVGHRIGMYIASRNPS